MFNKSLLFKVLCVLLFLYSYSKKGYSQKGFSSGYVVTQANDTIKAQIKLSDLDKNQCVYLDSSGKNLIANPEIIKAFGILGGRAFLFMSLDSIKNPVQAYFEVLAKGKMNLYFFSKRFFVQKNNGTVYELLSTEENKYTKEGTNYIRNKKEYIGLMRFLLSDSKTAMPDLTDIDFTRNDLLKVVRIYNEGESYIQELNRLKYKPNFRFGIEAVVASDNYKFRFPSKSFIDEYKGTFLSPGIGLTAKYQFTRHLSVNSGVRTKYVDYSIFKMYGAESSKRYYTLKNNFITLSVPVVMDCQFDKLPFRPYAGLGVQVEKNFQKSTTCLEESTTYTAADFYTYEYRTNFSNPINSYWIAEIGGNPVIGKISFIVKAQYLMSLPVVNPNEESQFYHQSGLQLILGVTF